MCAVWSSPPTTGGASSRNSDISPDFRGGSPRSDDLPVRDSRDPNSPASGFAIEAFSSFVAGVKAGEFGIA
ncbi:DUF397 domain-containing protein [Streptomyces luteireticuli]|uniref:DUF397 domain-containing protein n=1 Tax=Streptomyces luteireticuli TaxID=173858 RepID=UPI0035590C66